MKKLLSLFLALVMVLSLASFAAAEEPFEISVLLPEFPADIDFVMENNPVLQAIQEKTGVKLNIQWGPNSTYGDILNTTLSDFSIAAQQAGSNACAASSINRVLK